MASKKAGIAREKDLKARCIDRGLKATCADLSCSSKAPNNELCYGLVPAIEIEQCPTCLGVFCYHCIQQHDCGELKSRKPEIREALRTVLEGFEQHIFVRNIEKDHEPGWSLKLLKYIGALATLSNAVEKSNV